MRRADRLFQLVQLIRGRRLSTAAYLAERLAVTPRTIYRDVADLQHQGVPIEGEAGVGYRLGAGFDLPPLMFTEDEAKARGIKVRKGLFPWNASGRAIANGRDEGFTKLLFDGVTHAIVGGGIVGTHAGDMIGEVALAIEMGADAVDIGKTIHPHPTLGESIGLAAEAFEGACTDLPPVKR